MEGLVYEAPRQARVLNAPERRTAEQPWTVPHGPHLSEGRDAHLCFDDRAEGRTKVLAHPDGSHP
ncbi:hypothetical protein [Streptomyces winkii]|uniref:hypothetical protein n=1 Tax=Streptomyces winkii TaxID=3051178 RepID=UPI0028D590D0|nr:hypothetical protein [Streptomyces sp. DSM 40971]